MFPIPRVCRRCLRNIDRSMSVEIRYMNQYCQLRKQGRLLHRYVQHKEQYVGLQTPFNDGVHFSKKILLRTGHQHTDIRVLTSRLRTILECIFIRISILPECALTLADDRFERG